MSDYDLVIRNGTIVDGTRLPAFKADLAIKRGRIAQISGRIAGEHKRELDATGCYVAPGAIDLHCHYDAQVNWDPYCTLSGWHGITSLTIGQCGFGFAPVRPEDRTAAMEMMCRIEAVPMESMQAGMRWDWVSFPEYLDSLGRQGLGLNIASMVSILAAARLCNRSQGFARADPPHRLRDGGNQAAVPRGYAGRRVRILRRQELGGSAR